jgi:predicted ribosomally synthesized six-cysteine peptide SCIFF
LEIHSTVITFFSKGRKKLFSYGMGYAIIVDDIIAKFCNRRLNEGGNFMKRIKTLNTRNLKDTMKKGGCGECQTSCQSACKTSCTVGNQSCENK